MANNTGKKYGGRTKGTPNRITAFNRDILSKIMNEQMESLPELLNKLSPQQKINSIIKLMPFVAPRYQALIFNDNIPDENDGQLDIEKLSDEELYFLHQLYQIHNHNKSIEELPRAFKLVEISKTRI